jgi:hypothetical protein
MLATCSFGDAIARGVLILAIILAVVGVAAVSRAAEQKTRTRDDVLAALAVAEQTLAAQPDNAPARQQLARLLYESGDFWRAAEVIQPALSLASVSPEAILLAAELEYLLGHYAQAESLYRDLLAHAQADSQSRVKAKVALGFIYYQTNRFDRFKELEFGQGVEFPGDKVIRSFERPPYGLTWHGEERLSELPFLMTDPLPVMTVEYDARPVHVLFDTGADMCILDSELAEKFGIKEESWTVGAFGGGKLGKMGYGKLRSVKVGNVSLADVPIWIMPTQRFSAAFADGEYPIGGIIGTALVRQFLATLDYEHGKLVLRERSARARDELRKQLDDRIAAEVPFVLTSTHWMMARGSLNGRDGLTFFVDSGLAADAAFAAPPQTLRYVGIPEPVKKLAPGAIGGGGGAWASGEFAIQALGLGPLRQQQLKGEFGSMAAGTYWQNGFIQDGLISHGFLRKYDSWTIDFDAMTYLFAAKATR